jgi:hypothetical protein
MKLRLFPFFSLNILCCTNLSLRLIPQYNCQMNKPTPKIYRTTNWSSYNRARIHRGNIAIWFDSATTEWYAPSIGKHGRNQIYSDAAIQCCLMIKSLFRLSLRMVTGFVQSLIKLSGLNGTAPDYSTICRRQKHIAISYQKTCDGLYLLIDSTGLSFLGEGEWKRKKHQPEYRRQWRKLHIDIDAETLQIRAVQLTKIMSVTHSFLVIYLIKLHKMSGLTLFILKALMTPSNAPSGHCRSASACGDST